MKQKNDKTLDYIFTSERLGFRNWHEDDLSKLFKLSSDPIVMEFFPRHASKGSCLNFIHRMKHSIEECGYGFYAVELLSSKKFIGFIGICNVELEGVLKGEEIGWRLIPEVWGNGYATEGAIKCLDHGFKKIGLNEIYSFTAKLNKRSERIMQKIGMKKIGGFLHPKLETISPLQAHVLYQIKNKN